MMHETAPSVSRRELLIFLYKYRLRLTLSFLLPFALAVALSFLPVPRYKANSVLIVRMGSEYVYQPEIGNYNGGPTSNIPLSNDQIFKSEVAILNSDDLHRQVIETIGLEKMFPELIRPTGVDIVKLALHKEINDFLSLMGFSTPRKAIPEGGENRLLSKAVEAFDRHFDIVLEKESAVINISYEHKDYALASEALDHLLTLYFEKRKQLYSEPRSALAMQEAEVTHEKALAAARAVENFKRGHDIYSLQEQRENLLHLREQAQQQSMAIANPVLERKISDYNHQLDQLDADERQLNNLQKEAEITGNAYSIYAGKLDEAKAHDNLQHAREDSVRVIQPPTVQSEPKRLQPLIIIGGFFLSLVFMLAVAALTEFSRSGFLSPEQIERGIGLPVLATLPLRRRWWQLRN